MDMKSILLHLSEALAEDTLNEEGRAPVYHATGPYGMLEILRKGVIRSSPGKFVSTSRDRGFRYYWTNTYGDSSHAPFQFVLDQEVLRQRFRMKPFDYGYDGQGGSYDGMEPRAEREERVYTSEIPVNSKTVKEIIFEPVTAEFLSNAGYADEGYLIQDPKTRDYVAINPKVYYEIEHLARDKGIPIVDQRKQAVTESKAHKVEIGNNLPFRVFENPLPVQIERIGGAIRGVIDRAGDVYCWDAYDATHHDVEREMLLSVTVGFVVSNGSIELTTGDTEEFVENPNVIRMFGGTVPPVH